MTPDLRWLWRLVRRPSLTRDSRDELQFHVDAAVAALVQRGVPEAEARRRARLELGDVAVEAERLSDHRPGAGIETGWRDLRLAARSLGRSPTLVVIAVLLVALGVGASTSIFTLVDRVLLRPLPLPHPERIVRLYESSPARGIERTGVSRGNLAAWRASARGFDGLAVSYVVSRTLSEGDQADMVATAQVSCDFFDVLGVQPVLGTVFTEEQCRTGRFNSAVAPIGTDPVIVLAHPYWQSRFGGDPDIVGRRVLVDRRPFHVIAVLAPEAGVLLPDVKAYLAWELDTALPNDQRYATAFGRLRNEITLPAAQAEIEAIAAVLATEYPRTHRDWTIRLVPLHEDAVGGLRPMLGLLLVAAGLLLCIACANVALLLSARALSRAHEASLHLALGSSIGRLLRQALMEAALLAGVGGLLGTALAFAMVRILRSAWRDLPRAAEVAPDATALGFAVVATLASAILAGVVPALRHARAEPIDALRGGRRSTPGRRAHRARELLVTVEVALTVVLLAGAGLLVRTVNALRDQPPGYDPRDVTVVPVFLDSERYRSGADARGYYAELFGRLRALPGVVAVGGATTLPASTHGPDFARPAWPASRAGDVDAVRPASVRIVTPGYFDALRIPVVRGRGFDDRDGPDGRPVIAVSEGLARRLWPDRDPVGERIMVDYAGTYSYEVVAVVRDVRFGGPRAEPLEEIYFPHAQRSYLILNVAIRGRPGATPSPDVIRGVLRSIDPLKPPQGVHRLDTLLAATWRREQRAMQLLLGFGAAAVLLSALGIYGMIAYRVRETRRDIGVRLALGASPRDVAGWVAGQVGWVLVRSALVGLAVAAIGAQSLGALLYGVPPHDPGTALVVLALIGATGALATVLPAVRAARVDPSTALRVD